MITSATVEAAGGRDSGFSREPSGSGRALGAKSRERVIEAPHDHRLSLGEFEVFPRGSANREDFDGDGAPVGDVHRLIGHPLGALTEDAHDLVLTVLEASAGR